MWIAPSGVCLIDGYEYSQFLASLELLVRQNPSPTSRSRMYGHVRPPSSEMAMLSGARGVPQNALRPSADGSLIEASESSSPPSSSISS